MLFVSLFVKLFLVKLDRRSIDTYLRIARLATREMANNLIVSIDSTAVSSAIAGVAIATADGGDSGGVAAFGLCDGSRTQHSCHELSLIKCSFYPEPLSLGVPLGIPNWQEPS